MRPPHHGDLLGLFSEALAASILVECLFAFGRAFQIMVAGGELGISQIKGPFLGVPITKIP